MESNERKSGEATAQLGGYFENLADPRVRGRCDHDLMDMVVLALCAVIAGAEGWVAVEEFGKARLQWLKQFLQLRNGIPSHDTLGRVFSLLDPNELSRCFAEWTAAFAQVTGGEVVAIDGKTARRSFHEAGRQGALHMVSAWACGSGVTLGQVATEAKSNEITAIPRLLQLLDLQGCLVTIDAEGCQKAIVEKIREQGADYVLALKENQPTLHKEVCWHLHNATSEGWQRSAPAFLETVDGDHGRVETRRYWLSDEYDFGPVQNDWRDLGAVGMVESDRQVGTERTVERRYFITSLVAQDVAAFANGVRRHWCVENQLHWVLDVAFREDESRVRTGHAQANLAITRRHALNLLRRERTVKRGVATKQLKAALDPDYHLRILAGAG